MDDKTLERLFDKIDKIKEDSTDIRIKIAELPCGVHKEKMEHQKRTNNRMWAVILLLLSGILGLAWRSLR
jgi:hypothetical protein